VSDGISVNVDRVVGEEIAKLIVAQIPEKELDSRATYYLNELYANKGWNGSDMKKLVSSIFLNQMKEKVQVILDSEEHKTQMDKMAIDIVEDITKRTKELMIENVSQRLAGNVVDPVFGVRNIIQQAVMEMLHK
jgi:galactitol-specific phosphotransferase system IIB component